MSSRSQLHAELSKWFGAQSDADLVLLVASGEEQRGWGITRVVESSGHHVFCKTLPLTDLDQTHFGTTRNVHQLPLAYNYGVGSAGLGPFRELEAHRRTTEWVLTGRLPNFPILYHARVLPLAGQTRLMDEAKLDRHMTYWGDDESIRRYLQARQESETCLALFIECLPHCLEDWLPDNQHTIQSVIDQSFVVTEFLRAEGFVHFDAHPSNVMTDGDQIYFTDFGLCSSQDFDLTAEERRFLEQHGHFDIAEFLWGLEPNEVGNNFVAAPAYRAALDTYRPVIALTQDFFAQRMTDPLGASRFDDTTAQRLLTDA